MDDLPEPRGIGVGISRDREWSSIGVCGFDDEGVPVVSLNQRREGTDWLVDESARISRDYGIPVAVDVGSNTGRKMAEKIRDAGGIVTEVNLDGYVAACNDIRDRVRDKRIRHPNHSTLTEHVEAARWRPVGDARQVFGHRISAGDIDGLVAVTLSMAASDTSTAFNIW